MILELALSFDYEHDTFEHRSLKVLETGLVRLGVELDERILSDFLIFHDLLLEANANVNLTKIIEWPDVVQRHYLDSISVFLAVPSLCEGKDKILDVGSGFGMPGLPLNLIFPKNKFFLLESVRKKLTFMNAVIEKMDLSNIGTVLGRAEDLAKADNHRESYSLVVSRAVATLPVLLEFTLPFCSIGGVVVAMKGGGVDLEIAQSTQALKILGGEIERVVSVGEKLPCSDGQLVVVRKISETPSNFPRKAGIPKKRPL
ncbi:MAG: 16S rRNA (guanine(527)-N(7))-methyltransferase RsmG [SAR202 cluster bacterium]|nr:MAG: 16S rRNA (guanine(527)-N(7))-methyltransferase RsmG [SAR202 cluster bacterium]